MARKDIYATDYTKSTLLSPIEAQILSQYQLLAVQLNTLSSEVKQLNSTTNQNSHPLGKSSSSEDGVEATNSGSADILLDNLRNLEMKIGLVYTLFKGAVYSLFLQYEEDQNLKNDEEQRRNDDSDEEPQNHHEIDAIEGENNDDMGDRMELQENHGHWCNTSSTRHKDIKLFNMSTKKQQYPQRND